MSDVNREQEAMLIARTLRSGFERDAGPGNSVNSTQNPYVIVLQGGFDLLKIGRLIGEAVENWHLHLIAQAAKEAEAAAKAAPPALET